MWLWCCIKSLHIVLVLKNQIECKGLFEREQILAHELVCNKRLRNTGALETSLAMPKQCRVT